MTRNDQWNGYDRKKLDDAWERLQEKLKDEPLNPQWEQWNRAMLDNETLWPETEHRFGVATQKSEEKGMKEEAVVKMPTIFHRWKHSKYRRWASGAIAAGLLTMIIATPAGNNALAAILGQFRMEQITTIQENDVELLFHSFFPDGEVRESANKFGTFTRATGTIHGEYDLAEISKLLNRKIVVPKNFHNQKVAVNPSDTITLSINVAEVNRAMSKLGASKLLPESIDRKPISITLGESVHMDVNEGKDKYASFVQQPVPEIRVDASIDMKEALEAVIDFPLLPQQLKSSLESSGILNGGSVPLPVIADEETKMIKIDGYDVVLKMHRFGEQNAYYNAMWIKDGNIYELSGNLFDNQEELEANIAELIRQ